MSSYTVEKAEQLLEWRGLHLDEQSAHDEDLLVRGLVGRRGDNAQGDQGRHELLVSQVQPLRGHGWWYAVSVAARETRPS